MRRSDISRNGLFWRPDPEGSTGPTSAPGLGQVSMDMLPLPMPAHRSEPGERSSSLILSKRVSSLPIPPGAAPPGLGWHCRQLCMEMVSLEMPQCQGAVAAFPQVPRSLGRSCQLPAVS